MNRTRPIAGMLAAILLVLCMAPTVTGADAKDYKDTLNTLSSKYDALEKEQKQAQQNINKAKSEKDKKIAVKRQLDGQIIGVREQIGLLTQKINLLEQKNNEKQAEMENQMLRIEDNYNLLKKRLRVMYTTGNASVLGLVLGAEDFSEFLTRTQVTSRVAAHDQELIKGMQTELAAIQKVKDEIEANKADVETSKAQLADKQTQLGGQLTQAEGQIEDIEELEREYKANKSKIDKQMAQVQAEVDEIYKQINSVGEYEGGIMLWPVAGYYTVTSPYGPRWGDFHTGIDIARTNASGQGIFGKPILAAADGKVAFTQLSYRAGVGYGIYLILDHGGGISTLYGHTSGLAVKMGDTVKRGQTIAYVGSTGWSTGPHLHFEVRINGKHTSPMTYLK